MKKLVLLRHGQSEWNLSNRFTGWVDVELSERGIAEAKLAGQLIKEQGISFDIAYTSVLKRAIRTLWITMDELDQLWLPVTKSWKLNERHYGALQGLDKAETMAKHGEEQVHKWRRGYAIKPPALDADNEMHPSHDIRYQGIENLPATESLASTLERVIPYWEENIVPQLKQGLFPIIAAHGNSLRALVKHIDNISDEDIMDLNIPTGIPLVYEFDDQLNPLKSYYLGDQEKMKAAIDEVSNQAKQ